MNRKSLTLDEAGVETIARNALVPGSDDDDEFGELPEGVCPSCTGLSPGISADGETIIHCKLCGDTGKVTVDEAERWHRR